MEALHPDYTFFHVHRFRGYVLAAHADALRDTFLKREGCRPVLGAGRGGLFRFTSPLGDAYLRVYKRGGAMRHFVEESYVLDNRPLAEFRIHTHLADAGFPVPKLLGVMWHKVGPIYRGAIATCALEGQTLLEACAAGQPGVPDSASLAQCGALIRRLHDAGIEHADLNASNLFLTPAGPYLLDFDRARQRIGPLPAPIRRANLTRLHRSLRKNGVADAIYASILRAYDR